MLTNHVVVIMDRSGSMHPIRYDVVNQFNEQLATIKARSNEENQYTTISLYTFSYGVDHPIIFGKDVNGVNPWSFNQYVPGGATALWDAVGQAITDMKGIIGANDPDTSFLFLIITDGEENNSKRYNSESIMELMSSVVATDRWTFAFLVPRSGVRTLQRSGVPMGNIQPWSNTSAGVKEYGEATRSAFSGYFSARSQGVKATTKFFVTDMTGVNPEQLKAQLKDVSQNYLRLNVPVKTPISDFVSKTTGKKYQKGVGFYQLTKAESIQDYKELIIQDKATNTLYGGPAVRGVLGFPDFGTIRVHPGNHAGYNIFVQSTSVNRKLQGGTEFLMTV